jgi:hypothetical protein
LNAKSLVKKTYEKQLKEKHQKAGSSFFNKEGSLEKAIQTKSRSCAFLTQKKMVE